MQSGVGIVLSVVPIDLIAYIVTLAMEAAQNKPRNLPVFSVLDRDMCVFLPMTVSLSAW